MLPSFRSSLSICLEFLDRLLQFANIVEGEFSRLRQLCHHRLRLPPKKTQNLVEQPVPRHVPCHDRLKDMGVTDLSNSPQGFFSFQPVDSRLDGGVRGA